MLGPTLGGVITDKFRWRWVFLINVPVGVVTFAGGDARWSRTRRGRAAARRRISTRSASALIVLGLGCLQVVLDRGEDDGLVGLAA